MVFAHKSGGTSKFKMKPELSSLKHAPSAKICPWPGLISSQNLLGKINCPPPPRPAKGRIVGLKQATGITKTLALRLPN